MKTKKTEKKVDASQIGRKTNMQICKKVYILLRSVEQVSQIKQIKNKYKRQDVKSKSEEASY